MSMIKNRTMIHRGIFRYCLLGIAFLLPVFGRLVPSLIALMVLNWLIEGRFRQKFRLVSSDRIRMLTLSFGLFYLLYLAGLIYTSNFEYGLFDLQVKFSLFIFPLLLATADEESFSNSQRRQLLIVFISGCLAGSLLFMGRAFVEAVYNHAENAFSYAGLSWYFHSSYLSMYYNFAIAAILGHLITLDWKRKIPWRILEAALILWFIILVFLLSSKAGILTLGGILLFCTGLLVFKRKNWLGGIIVLVVGAGIFYTTYRILPGPYQRMETAGEVIRSDAGNLNQSPESTAERLAIWKASTEIIRDHYLLGVGTGDVKDALYGKYAEKSMYSALNKKLNAHCQYLQTFIALGVAGFLFLVLMLMLPGILAIRRKDNLYLVFLGIFAFNILVESMFETQAGVVFYAFFNAFLFISMSTPNQRLTDITEKRES
ncbi:MAG: O-antigen ligase domain-containing protein [Bacteroidetes bacterium]|nr:MAG: O-antigen ligase domain-containing protein [Bacteroidota bacterium]